MALQQCVLSQRQPSGGWNVDLACVCCPGRNSVHVCINMARKLLSWFQGELQEAFFIVCSKICKEKQSCLLSTLSVFCGTQSSYSTWNCCCVALTASAQAAVFFYTPGLVFGEHGISPETLNLCKHKAESAQQFLPLSSRSKRVNVYPTLHKQKGASLSPCTYTQYRGAEPQLECPGERGMQQLTSI